MTEPALTFVLLTPDDFSTVRTTAELVGLEGAGMIELLVVTADPARLDPDPAVTNRFFSFGVVKADMSRGAGAARAAAARAARAPVIAFGEDHSFPQPGWAAAILAAHGGEWAAVGPVVTNANPGTLVSWADLLMGYGPWLAPGRSAERSHLPGHNSSYRKDVLLTLGDELGDLFEAETALQWKLRARGHRLFQESAARVAHTNFERWNTWIPVSFHAGRVFAATRARSWSGAARVAFALASPLVPFVRMWRHLGQAFAAGLAPALIVRTAPVLAIGLIVDAAGQFAGCILGAGNSPQTLVDWEFHRNAPHVTVQVS
ncbi:MAG: hypothetical protein ACSLFK_03190 [Gemmatimonadaceae bacterium]